ncbi:MAG: hypothetical protein JAZ03_14420, partial [Candidatus Thiodiazotropha taylori]|nr:hypothetical protein [Candidatus Thiodiazotropha taylori]MCW4335125.1 hypothetical protein [Candidatus Thiodiazotropha endolucinida]
ETLSLDNFTDAITDSDIRMRLRELGPKTLAEAEQIAVRMEAYKIADKQRSRLVGRLDTEGQQTGEEQMKSNNQFEMLSEAISSLTNQVKNLYKQNAPNKSNGTSYNQKLPGPFYQSHQNYGRPQKLNQPLRDNQAHSSENGLQRPAGQSRGNNSNNYHNQNSYQNQNQQHRQNGAYQGHNNRNQVHFGNQNSGGNFPRQQQSTGMNSYSQENMNRSAWRPTNRQH